MSEDQTQISLRTVLEAVNSLGVELHQVRAGVAGLETRLDEIQAETRSGFRNVERQIGVLSKDIVGLRADVGDLTERLEKVEVK